MANQTPPRLAASRVAKKQGAAISPCVPVGRRKIYVTVLGLLLEPALILHRHFAVCKTWDSDGVLCCGGLSLCAEGKK